MTMVGFVIGWLIVGGAGCGGSTTGLSAADGTGPSGTPSSAPTDTVPTTPAASAVAECDSPDDAWIWCDDFERDRLDAYFEHNRADGAFERTSGVGLDGSHGMRARFSAGAEGAGWMHLAFGRTPQPYFRPVDDGATAHREVWWRFLVRNEPGWTGGGGHKLTRARAFASPDTWQQAFEAPLWSGGQEANRDVLVLDPVSGTDEQGNLLPYESGSLGQPPRWLGSEAGATPLFDASHVGSWYCVEVHLRLNDPGQSNGVFEFWIDGSLEARREGLNWVGSFTDYGVNTISLDNYWNGGAPRDQERYLDNFVVSTAPIGCG
jgi:hypothetical protein